MSLDLINQIQSKEVAAAEVVADGASPEQVIPISESKGGAAPEGGTTVEPLPGGEGGAAPDAPKPIPDFKWLEQVSGGKIKTEDDLKGILSSTESAIPKTIHQEILSERDTLKLKLDGAYENDFVRGLNELVKGGAGSEQLNTYIKLNQVGNLNDISARDALVHMNVFQNKLSESDAKFLVDQKYPQTLEEVYAKNDHLDPDDERDKAKAENILRSAKIELQTESSKAREFLNTYKAEMSYSKAQAQAKQQQEQQGLLTSEWEKVTPTVASRIKSVPISFVEGDFKYDFEVPIPEDYVQKMSAQIPGYAAQKGYTLSEENANLIVNDIRNNYIIKNFASISKTIALDVAAKMRQQMATSFSNGADIKREIGAGAQAAARSPLEMILSRQNQ